MQCCGVYEILRVCGSIRAAFDSLMNGCLFASDERMSDISVVASVQMLNESEMGFQLNVLLSILYLEICVDSVFWSHVFQSANIYRSIFYGMRNEKNVCCCAY